MVVYIALKAVTPQINAWKQNENDLMRDMQTTEQVGSKEKAEQKESRTKKIGKRKGTRTEKWLSERAQPITKGKKKPTKCKT